MFVRTFILKEILMQGLFLCLEILSSTTGNKRYKSMEIIQK